jgi:hypothetical protein
MVSHESNMTAEQVNPAIYQFHFKSLQTQALELHEEANTII